MACGLPPGLVEGAKASAQFIDLKTRQPLLCWRAWNAPAGKTSQLRAVSQLGTRETCFFGGNRSGKTVLARVLAICFALGGDHPAVRALIAALGVNWKIPRGPGTVFMVALNSDASREYHREEIADLLPGTGVHWHNRAGKGVAWVSIDVPGHDKRARIVFKSCDAGRRAMQGSSVRAVIFDEEPPQDVYNEAKMRVLDQAGVIILSMTPLKGVTWVARELAYTPNTVEKQAHWLFSADNPYLPAGEVEAQMASLSEAERAARAEGQFLTLEGRVYGRFQRSIHVVKRFPIPDDWPRYRAIDFGLRNPFCCLWAALSPEGVLFIYREYYRAEATINDHAKYLKSFPESIAGTWADPEDPAAIKALRKDHGLRVKFAKKDVRKGIDKVKTRLDPDQKGGPRLFVFDNCEQVIAEWENYIWLPESSRGADPRDRPLKRDDHGMDDVRYIVMGVDRPRLKVAA